MLAQGSRPRPHLILDRVDHARDFSRRAAGASASLRTSSATTANPPLLAGASGFDRVEREQVGLIGDVPDDLDDIADLVRALAEGLDQPCQSFASRRCASISAAAVSAEALPCSDSVLALSAMSLACGAAT